MTTPDVDAASLARWRADTPGCEGVVHLNNAGASLVPASVAEAIREYLELEGRVGGYEAEEMRAGEVAGVYGAIGGLIGAEARNVALVESATAGMGLALSSFDWRAGDRIVTSRSDYPSNQIMYMSLARRMGVETVVAEELPEGGIDPESVRALVRDGRCRLVALSWVPTNSGMVQGAYEVGAVCAEEGVSYAVDACQSVGQIAIDVERLGCDFLTASARKFMRGPRGMGFLYVSDRALARGAYPLLPDMRGAEWTGPGVFKLVEGAQRFETWEFSYALVLGMGEAARYTTAVGAAGMARARHLAAELRAVLSGVPAVRVLDRGAERCAIVTIAIPGRDAEEVKVALRKCGINTSVSRREDGVLDMDDKGAATALRISPHYYNTEAELDRFLAVLADILASGPKPSR